MKKLINLLLVLLLLTGCSFTKTSRSNSEAEYYLDLLKNFEVKEKDVTSDNPDKEDFNDFLDEVFKESIESDYTYFHSSVEDYKSFGLNKPEVTLGTISYGLDEDEISNCKEILDKLESFDYDTLSYSQQYDYDILRYSYYESLCGLYYGNYNLLFSSENDFSSTLVTALTEFSLYDEESIEDYLIILEDVPRYINEAMSYTDSQVKDGIKHTKYMLNDQISYLDEVAVDENNTILETFKNSINDVDFIDSSKKEDYISKVEALIKEKVNPSLKELSTYLSKLKTTDSKNASYYAIDPSYAEYKFIVATSNNGDVNTIYSQLVNYYNSYVENYNAFLSDEASLDEFYALNDSELLNSDYKTQLEYLKDNMDEKYTNIGDVEYIVSALDTLGSSTAAYYVSAPFDNQNLNVIRVNANNTGSDKISNFEILSHEGFPGHLYQHIKYYQSNPRNVRLVQSFLGYTEGWADLASNDALGLLSDNELVLAYIRMSSVTMSNHIMYSMMTMMINVYGYSLKDFKEYCASWNIEDSDVVQDLYDYIVAIGDTYCTYGVGFTSHYYIRENAKDELDANFSYTTYHDRLLENGTMPFVILNQLVSDYIDEMS